MRTRDDLNRAFKAVVANKGCASIDGMEVGELLDHLKSLAKCKARLSDLTSCSRGQSLDVFRENLRGYVAGWVDYFGRASMKRFATDTAATQPQYWKQWKKSSMRIKALRTLGVPEGRAFEWATPAGATGASREAGGSAARLTMPSFVGKA